MKSKKTWFLLSFACILLGTLLSAGGVALGGIPGFYLDRTGIHGSRESTRNSVESFSDVLELEDFDRMELDIHDADVTLVPSDRYAVDYRIAGVTKAPVCKVEDGRLIFQDDPSRGDPRLWFLYVGPDASHVQEQNHDPYYVNIEFPADRTFSEIRIQMESGDLTLPDLSADTLQVTDEYGDVSLEGLTGQDLKLSMSSGDFSAGRLAAVQAELRNEYGDLSLESYSGDSLSLDTSSSYLTLGDIQAKLFQIRNEYGDILISQVSGDCLTVDQNTGSFLADRLDVTDTRIRNEYGDVQLRLAEDPAVYGCDLHTGYGFIRVDGRTIPESDDDQEVSYRSAGAGKQSLQISCENGGIVVDGP